MTFIITLISLVIERFFHWRHMRNWYWFSRYQKWFADFNLKLPPFLLLIVCILPLLIAVWLINHLFDNALYGFLKLIFGIAVLVYCMGPYNLWVEITHCIHDFHVQEPTVAIETAQTAFGIVLPKNSEDFHIALTKAIFIEGNTRLFAVIFWFVLLGPVGAVLYRTVSLCAKESKSHFSQQAMVAKELLDWLPIRIFTFLFSLGGQFTEVFKIWKNNFKLDLNENNTFLAECGLAALNTQEKEQTEVQLPEITALELLDRVFVIGLVFLAVMEFIFW